MANQITDNRTLLFDGGDGIGGAPVDLGGAGTGTADTSTFLEGTSSYTISASNTLVGMMYDALTAQNWANNVFYLTFNSGVVGLMATKAGGGFRIRFCGATVTDFFEVYVGGSDSWPSSIQGGWTNFVVDIEDARAAAITNGWTGGTTPATSAIRYVGIANLLNSMPKMADNTWLDTIHRLPAITPAVIIEGRNGGIVDWNSADIVTQLGTGQMLFYNGPGGSYIASGPIQFGINDITTHGFTDTSKTWLWDTQEFAPTDLYKISALGNSGGITNVTFGVKTGTGNTASGSQGLNIQAESTAVRWDMDFNDPNLDTIGLYGCGFLHGGAFLLDDISIEVISCLYIDITSALISNSVQLKNSIINANTLTGVAFMTTDDLADIINCTFEFSVGHAIELTGIAGSYTLDNVLFTGYGANTTLSAALYVSAASGVFTINVDNTTTERSPTATVTIVESPITTIVTITDENDSPLQNVRIFLEASNGTGDLPYQDSITITSSGTTATVVHTAHGMSTNDWVNIKGAIENSYNGVFPITVTGVNGYTYVMGTTTTSPATGTPITTGVLIQGLTNISGIITDSRTISVNQPIVGHSRLSTTTPRYKSEPISSIINKTLGVTISRKLRRDD